MFKIIIITSGHFANVAPNAPYNPEVTPTTIEVSYDRLPDGDHDYTYRVLVNGPEKDNEEVDCAANCRIESLTPKSPYHLEIIACFTKPDGEIMCSTPSEIMSATTASMSSEIDNPRC